MLRTTLSGHDNDSKKSQMLKKWNHGIHRRAFIGEKRLFFGATDAYELFSMIESVTVIGVSLCMEMPSTTGYQKPPILFVIDD